MIRTESSGGWRNQDCSIALPYVCKKKPNATVEPVQPGELGSRRARAGGVTARFSHFLFSTDTE